MVIEVRGATSDEWCKNIFDNGKHGVNTLEMKYPINVFQRLNSFFLNI